MNVYNDIPSTDFPVVMIRSEVSGLGRLKSGGASWLIMISAWVFLLLPYGNCSYYSDIY